MNGTKLTTGLTKRTVYNIISDEGCQHYTCYYSNDFKFFYVCNAGKNIGLKTFIPENDPSILFISDDLKSKLIEVIKEYSYYAGVYDPIVPLSEFDKWIINDFKAYQRNLK